MKASSLERWLWLRGPGQRCYSRKDKTATAGTFASDGDKPGGLQRIQGATSSKESPQEKQNHGGTSQKWSLLNVRLQIHNEWNKRHHFPLLLYHTTGASKQLNLPWTPKRSKARYFTPRDKTGSWKIGSGMEGCSAHKDCHHVSLFCPPCIIIVPINIFIYKNVKTRSQRQAKELASSPS